MSTIHPARSARNLSKRAPSVSELRQKIAAQCRDLIGFAIASGREETTFTEFEQRLREHVFAFARALTVLFLTCAETRVRSQTPTRTQCSGRSFQRTRARDRSLTTWFGTVRYWPT